MLDEQLEHLSFQSILPDFPNAKSISCRISEALMYQHIFRKITTPWEMADWEDDELQFFEIETDNIDRLYHINFEDVYGDSSFELIARTQYKGQPLFIELKASCDYHGFDCDGVGAIFVSRDANVFMDFVLNSSHKKKLIYDSLRNDGIHICKQNCFFDPWRGKNVPMLLNLCYQKIYQLQKISDSFFINTLNFPTSLIRSINEFTALEKAREKYEFLF